MRRRRRHPRRPPVRHRQGLTPDAVPDEPGVQRPGGRRVESNQDGGLQGPVQGRHVPARGPDVLPRHPLPRLRAREGGRRRVTGQAALLL